MTHRQRIAQASDAVKTAPEPALAARRCDFSAFGSSVTPSSGVNSTATIQETISETAITTNSVKVNSPAALELSPIGMKPATVTSVPVSIGNAVEV